MKKYLINLADHLDKKGFYKEASYIDLIMKRAFTDQMLGGGPVRPDSKDSDPAFIERTRIKSLDEIIKRDLFKYIFLEFKIAQRDGGVSIKREDSFQEELYKAWEYLFENTKRPFGKSMVKPFRNGEPSIIEMSDRHTSFQKFIIFIHNKGSELQVGIQARDDFSGKLVSEKDFYIKNTEENREYIAKFVDKNKLERHNIIHKD